MCVYRFREQRNKAKGEGRNSGCCVCVCVSVFGSGSKAPEFIFLRLKVKKLAPKAAWLTSGAFWIQSSANGIFNGPSGRAWGFQGTTGIRMREKHRSSIATCLFGGFQDLMLVLKKQHGSNGGKMEIFWGALQHDPLWVGNNVTQGHYQKEALLENLTAKHAHLDENGHSLCFAQEKDKIKTRKFKPSSCNRQLRAVPLFPNEKYFISKLGATNSGSLRNRSPFACFL